MIYFQGNDVVTYQGTNVLSMDQQQSSQIPQEPQTRASVPTSKNSLGIPIAIVLSALLIAGAIVYTGKNNQPNPVQVGNNTGEVQETGEIAPVTEKDHIRGNPNAPIVIIEYSDYDCPFCKKFHETMNQIMDEYAADGKVAWVFRHFPLEQLHPNAPKVAEASECVASLGGDDAFWKFSDLVYEDRTTNEPSKMARLSEYAEMVGVSKDAYTKCMETGTFAEVIASDIEEAITAGARGTPYSIMMVGDQKGLINGAQPYEVVKKMVDTLILQIGAKAGD
jgi:protein-disulfide isomerase